MSNPRRPRYQSRSDVPEPRSHPIPTDYWTPPPQPSRWRLAAYPIIAILALALFVAFKVPARSSVVLQPAAQVGTRQGSSSPAARAATANGTYLGAVIPDPYGQVQVSITLSAGRITEVTAVQLPSEGRSGFISQAAGPILKGEAIAAQSAKIDTVSGATYTSEAYAQSLQSALDAAHA